MSFCARDNLTDADVRAGLNYVVRDGIASQAMGILTGGAFLVAFAIKLGASNFTIGLLAAIGPLMQLLQLPVVAMVERFRNRKLITVLCAGLGRMCWLFIALLPLVFPAKVALGVMLALLVLFSALGAMGGCSWNSWMRDLIPTHILGSFFARRMQLSIGIGIVLSILAGVYVDVWKRLIADQEILGYSLLFIFGFGAGMVGLYFLYKTPEPRMTSPSEGISVFRVLLQPFKDVNFRRLIVFLSSWNFAANLAGPFFMVYMLKRLELNMSVIIGLSVLSQIFNYVFLRIWGRFADRFSNKSVLAVSGPLFMLAILAWTFTTMPEKHLFTIPLLIAIHVVMGLSSAGVALGSGNIGMKLAPKGQATAYLAANTIVNSLAAGIAPILGGKFADFFAGRQLDWTLNYTSPGGTLTLPTLSLKQWDFFFVLAFVIGLYSLHRLRLIREEGEVEEGIVLRELIAEVRTQTRVLTTAGGLRQMVTFPITALRTALAGDDHDQMGSSAGPSMPTAAADAGPEAPNESNGDISDQEVTNA